MDDTRAVYEAVIAAQKAGTPTALCTVTRVQGSVPRHAGSKMLVYADGTLVGTVGGGKLESLVIAAAQAALADGQTRLSSYALNDIAAGDPGVCGGTVEVFIEPIALPPVLVVIGIGHVGRATAELGKWLGFHTIISDDRAEYCTPDFLPGMDGYVVCPPGQVAAVLAERGTPIARGTAIAAVTRGLPVDLQLIPALLATEAAYIGLIGSQRRWALTVKALTDAGLMPEQLRRVRAPIGLELEAETPKEIALSILAEIVMVRNRASGRVMSE